MSNSISNTSIKQSGYPAILIIHIKDFERFIPNEKNFSIDFIGQSIDDCGYKERVIAIKEYISKGVIYQVNLTNRFDFTYKGDLLTLAHSFYKRQKVPYFFSIIGDEFSIISGSMELFLSKEGVIITSKPIKGTSADKNSLFNSDKDKAENLMITDMMRNDLGRIAKTGTVKTVELFNITSYKTLFHMHSTVQAVTNGAFNDIISNTFPPASVTGTPKIKALQIIDELEPHSRGYYCGCAGLVKTNGDFILSVLIRTAYGRGNFLSYYAGCGIVWDSIPEREVDEMYLKVKAFFRLNQ